MKIKNIFKSALIVCLLSLNSCDTGYQTLEPGEYGIEFVKLPLFLGGGVRANPIEPGKAVLVLPWEDLYRIDTTSQTITWAGVGEGSEQQIDDTLQTRTIDGNEVLLSLTVVYHIMPNKVGHIIQYVAGDRESIMPRVKELVSTVARSDIRAHLNTLAPWDFYSVEKTAEALERTKIAMNARLNPEGIEIDSVSYKGHKFERITPEGNIDDSYQQRIDETQVTDRAVEQEKERIATVVEQKKIEYNEMLAKVNRQKEEALGRKEQAQLRGDSYLKAKELEAERIKAVGTEEIIALKKRIEALNGPGGEAILKMEIADALIKANPKFVVINNNNGIGVQKLDTNSVMQQLGIIEATTENKTPKE